MKISYNWLKSYVPNLPEAEKIADIFTFHVCEIESTEKIQNGDYVFDIKILPDRAHDLLCHRGVAKDLSGILGLGYKDIEYKIPEGVKTDLNIKIEESTCRRYIGRIIRNIKVEQSQAWMQEYLFAMGQRSINNMVDASNIIMFDRGNPIHVFDLDKVHGSIAIRNAKKDETIVTLDGKEVKLNPANLVIADDRNVLAIAGVKGGKMAEVDVNTKNIIIEVANFDPISIRKTSKEVNIYTDAVKRYENDFSQEVASMAMNDMTALVLEICKEAIVEKIVDVYPIKQEERTLRFDIKKISKILGLDISISDVENIFKNYKIEYDNVGNNFIIKIPSMRLDLSIEEDMAEEIGRVLGYDKIKAILPKIKWDTDTNETFDKINSVRGNLLSSGYSEVMNYAFTNNGQVEVLASASDKKFLRTNLTNGLKESVKLNQINTPLLGINEVKVFEIGTVFKKDGEEIHVAWGDKKGIKEVTLNEYPKSLDLGGIRQGIYGTKNSSPKNLKFIMWSLFPFIARDIAVWVPEKVSSEEVAKIIKDNMGDMVVLGPELFDEFKKEGKISYAFRLVFQSYDRTLTDTEVNDIMIKITNKIKENNDWQVR